MESPRNDCGVELPSYECGADGKYITQSAILVNVVGKRANKDNNTKDNSEDDEITTAFNALVVNTDPNTLLNEDNQTTVYYTSYGETEPENATAIALELANRACSHAVTTIDTTTDAFSINQRGCQ